MGLLDNLFPGMQREDWLPIAAGLLSGQGNTFSNLGAGLLGMQHSRRQRLQDAALQAQLDQQARAQEEDRKLREAAQRRVTPGTPNFSEAGPQIPQSPGIDTRGLVSDWYGINPLKAMQLEQGMAKDTPFGKIDPKDYTPESLQLFAATGGRDFTLLRPRSKVEVSGGLAFDPYATAPGTAIVGPQSDVVPDGRGGYKFNPAKINPMEGARLGLQRQGLEQAERHFQAGGNQFDPKRGMVVNTRTGQASPVTSGGQPIGPEPNKPGEQYLKQQAGVANVRAALGSYRDALKGFAFSDLAKPDARAKIGTAYNNALLQAKEAYNLGVLNGPDYMILQQVLTNPLSAQGAITSKAAMDQQAQELDRLMQKIGQGSAAAHGQAGGGNDPLGIRK